MTAAPIHLAGERLMLDPAGALHWPATGMLVVSDLHLEKGSSYARKGMLLPPWDTHGTLDRLTLLLRRCQPRTVVALGDSFHDADGSARLPADEIARLNAMTARRSSSGCRATTIPRHRRAWAANVVESSRPAPWCSAMNAIAGATGEISGHYHPKATIPARGGSVSRPCFVTDARRVLLPAFGAYTGGLDVRDPAIVRLFPRGARVFLLGKERLFSFPLGTATRSPAE